MLKLRLARRNTDRAPSSAQKKAGNYRKGKLRLYGLDIALENPKGSVRSGRNKDGRRWTSILRHDYGYILGTVGRDKDHLDVFIGPDLEKSRLVFVINQIDQKTGAFDEHKIMLGFRTQPEAVLGYLANYERGWKVGPITTLLVPELKAWIKNGDTKKALPEWHRPCLWAEHGVDGPGVFVAKGRTTAKEPGKIKYGGKAHIGVDKRGRVAWRTTPVAGQLALFEEKKPEPAPMGVKPNTTEILPLEQYDRVIVSFSGGKDSVALVLHMLEQGVPKEKIEIWHQAIDGEPGSPTFMDWPVTDAYVRAFGEAMGIKVRYQWREGGMLQELLKRDAVSGGVGFETETGEKKRLESKSKPQTRGRWPAKSANLMVRWCSAFLKINVADRAITNDDELQGQTLLFLTGERREESANRAKYAEKQKHKTSTKKRRVDHWRAILDWPESDVWDIMKRWNIQPHPAYRLGWGRTSCMGCIFGDKNQWASVRNVAPTQFEKLRHMETVLKHTINMGKGGQPIPLDEYADTGKAFTEDVPQALIDLALSDEYKPEDIFVRGEWKHPKGAFKTQGGPS